MLVSHYSTRPTETDIFAAQILTHYVERPLSHPYALGWTAYGVPRGNVGDGRSPSAKPFLVSPVSRIMLLLGLEHPHVLPPVVRFDSVYVVNHLSLLQLATEFFLRNITMHGCSRVSKPFVALPVFEQLR